MNEKILVVDDELGIREFIFNLLSNEGFEVTCAENGVEAIEHMDKEYFDLVLTDLKMPKIDGVKVIKHITKNHPDMIGIVITGYGTISSAVNVMKAGAHDYITKPIQGDEVLIVIKRALEYKQLKLTNLNFTHHLKNKYKFENIIGYHHKMQEVFELVEKVADSDSTIIIYGKSGTGKELITRAIHFNSYRAKKPLIPVNCGAIPNELLESELFGHVKGAFTGATSTRIGRFEMAHGGTIFLDEIGDMSPELQVKILRVLQEKEFERVGGTKTIKVDVRIIAATHRNLDKAVAEEKFREDLYYRLNVIPIFLPDLKDRKTDIPILMDHFLEKFNQQKKKKIKGFSKEAMDVLIQYSWPGNVRELENLIERLVILKEKGEIKFGDLPEKVRFKEVEHTSDPVEISGVGICFNTAVTEFEKRLILQALEKTNWVKKKAAQLLNLKRTTLIEKMKKNQLMRQ
ncbi:MAG: sigma-54 dependent transcriptional regulator [Thermodesulfobacteriota bacterium]|nr:sigma-54 dependent transcriptional regulator [Thermodesulfobacteriota bacterium]